MSLREEKKKALRCIRSTLSSGTSLLVVGCWFVFGESFVAGEAHSDAPLIDSSCLYRKQFRAKHLRLNQRTDNYISSSHGSDIIQSCSMQFWILFFKVLIFEMVDSLFRALREISLESSYKILENV